MARDRKPLSVLTSAKASLKDRLEASGELLAEATENKAVLPALIAVLRDRAEPVELRRSILQTLQAATFSAPDMLSRRTVYIKALRELGDDPDEELRRRALGILAREKDGPTQKRLLEGLAKPEKALLSPEKALQLLSYDPHSGAYEAAEKVLGDPPNPVAKREALRLLATNPESAPLLLKTLRNKKEKPEIRQICAAALQALKPQQFLSYAREIVLDDKDTDPDINAMSLTALTQFGDEAKLTDDEDLHKTVNRLKTEAHTKVKKSAREFLKKYAT